MRTTRTKSQGSLPPPDDTEKENIKDFDHQSDRQYSTASGDGQDVENAIEPDENLSHSKARSIAICITVTGAAFLNTLNIQSVVIVLPAIGNSLKVETNVQQWVVSAYSLTFACFLLLWGRLADVYGKKLIFVLGSAWLTVASIVLPFITNDIGFFVCRGLQGLGGAANVPTAIGILGVIFKTGKAKNYAFATYGAGAPLGAVLGNILGGIIGEYLTYRWVFWLSAILSALITIAGYFVIPLPLVQHRKGGSKDAVDWVGGVLITIGLLLLQFVLVEGDVVGWSVPWVPALIVVSILIVAAFVCWQWYLETHTNRRPLMKISIWKNMRFTGAMIVVAFFYSSFNNFLIFASYFYQDYLGLSMIGTTLRFVATGVTGIIVSFLVAHALAKIPAAPFLTVGTAASAIASLLFAVPIPPNTTYWAWSFFAMILAAIGVDSVFPGLVLLVAQSLPTEDQALGGGLINASGQLGRAMGLAIGTATQTAVIAKAKKLSVNEAGNMNSQVGDPALLKGLRATHWLDFGLGVVAFIGVWVFFRGAGKLGQKR